MAGAGRLARHAGHGRLTGELAPLPGYQDVWETYGGKLQAAWQTFRALPAAEQRARVGELRSAALDCDKTDLLDILVAS